MPIANSGAAALLNKDWNRTDFTPAATYYIGFRNNGTELTNGDSPGYARISVTLNTTNFPLITGNILTNATSFSTPDASANWLEADEVAIYTASSGGSPRYTGLLDQPFQLLTGQHRSFRAGA